LERRFPPKRRKDLSESPRTQRNDKGACRKSVGFEPSLNATAPFFARVKEVIIGNFWHKGEIVCYRIIVYI